MPEINVFKNETNFQILEPGTVIFNRGDASDFMYAVLEGEVDILVEGRVVATVQPGSLFGEMALIDNGPRSATAKVRTTAKLVPVDKRRFMFMIQQTPFFALQVMQLMAERIRTFDDNVK